MTQDKSAADASVSDPQWLLYGANGYTGELIAREAAQRGLRPILAGRNAPKIHALAKELNLEGRVFSLSDQTATLVAMEDVALVLNCAGPFSKTAGLMMQACLASHAHYVDITGEIDVFELAHSLNDKAVRARSVLCPGAGFDVVPTDCIAASLREALPDATHLTLAFETHSRSSVGTAKTAVEMLATGGRVRKDGQLIAVPLGSRTREIDLGDGVRAAVGIPWGDVSTAYFTTGIPNVEVFMAGPNELAHTMRKAERWRWLLRKPVMQWIAKRRAARGPRGPNQTERDCNPTFVWGEAANDAHQRKVARIRTANGYAVTVHASLAIVRRLLSERSLAGYVTPAKLMGARFIESLPGSSTIKIEAA